MRHPSVRSIAVAALVAAGLSGPAGSAEPDRVDLAPSGAPLRGDGSLGVEWENPREVHEVIAVFGEGVPVPDPGALRLEWWGSVWPDNGTGGWMRLDDPWNGEWVPARAAAAAGPGAGTLSFRFPPLSKAEWKGTKAEQGPSFRRTLKVRLAGGPLPAALRVHGLSTWREASFDVELRSGGDGVRAGRIEVRNGTLRSLASLPPPRAVRLDGTGWTSAAPAGGSSGVRIGVRYAEAADPASNDLTRVTVRLGGDGASPGFSFVPQDVLAEGAMRVPTLGALVAESSRGLSLANDPGLPGPWARPVRGRLRERPEQTLAGALAGIPRLTPSPWAPLGIPAARQEPVVSPAGDFAFDGGSLHVPARDSARIPFRKGRLECRLDTRPEPLFDGGGRDGAVRSLEEGWLPMVRVEWRTGDLEFREAAVAVPLLGGIGDDEGRRGDETVALLVRLEARNRGAGPRPLAASFRWSHEAPLALAADGAIEIRAGGVPAGLRALRGAVATDRAPGGTVEGWSVRPAAPGASPVLRYDEELPAGAARTVFLKAPFVDLLEPAEAERLLAIRFDEEASKALAYWRGRAAGAASFSTPSGDLDDFLRASLWHILITTDRDPETGLFNGNVGTFAYRVFANETVMIARYLDMLGEHREAERLLEPLLRFQGSEGLTGRFSTKEAVFHGAGRYTHGQYAMNHGFVLWGIGDHYLLSRDRAWLDRAAPKAIAACDFLARERRSTMAAPGEPRSPVHGLAPASSLEDVVEYQYWLAANAYFHLGMKRTGEALRAAGHPEARRILDEAEAYRGDIERAAREAATVAAAARLRDGTWVPYVPPRIGSWRHRTEGWIREALYPALHLATGEVVDPSDPLMTWMLDDLEDNLFLSAESGYGVRDVDGQWFERGAVTLQPCLLDGPAIYLARGEPEAALRSFWNAYALLIYPDIRCLAEWARSFGRGGGPIYKTSDEARLAMWLRGLLLQEDSDCLRLAYGAPREWLAAGKEIRVDRAVTAFGKAGLRIRSEADRGRIIAEAEIPLRDPPREVWLRLRHPAGKTPSRVLGTDGKPVGPDRLRGDEVRLIPGEEPAGGRVRITAEYGEPR